MSAKGILSKALSKEQKDLEEDQVINKAVPSKKKKAKKLAKKEVQKDKKEVEEIMKLKGALSEA